MKLFLYLPALLFFSAPILFKHSLPGDDQSNRSRNIQLEIKFDQSFQLSDLPASKGAELTSRFGLNSVPVDRLVILPFEVMGNSASLTIRGEARDSVLSGNLVHRPSIYSPFNRLSSDLRLLRSEENPNIGYLLFKRDAVPTDEAGRREAELSVGKEISKNISSESNWIPRTPIYFLVLSILLISCSLIVVLAAVSSFHPSGDFDHYRIKNLDIPRAAIVMLALVIGSYIIAVGLVDPSSHDLNLASFGLGLGFAAYDKTVWFVFVAKGGIRNRKKKS